MSTAYHPQTDRMSEWAIRNITQVLRGCIANDQSDWVERLPMVEFVINSTINESSGFTLFELTYRNMPCIINQMDPTPFNGVKEFAEQALTNLVIMHDFIIASRSFQTYYANRHHTADCLLKTGNLVYLATKNLNLPRDTHANCFQFTLDCTILCPVVLQHQTTCSIYWKSCARGISIPTSTFPC